jgi:hypothetical protein
MPAAAQRRRMSPSCQRFTLRALGPDDLDHRLHRVRGHDGLEQRAGPNRPSSTGTGCFAAPSSRTAASTPTRLSTPRSQPRTVGYSSVIFELRDLRSGRSCRPVRAARCPAGHGEQSAGRPCRLVWLQRPTSNAPPAGGWGEGPATANNPPDPEPASRIGITPPAGRGWRRGPSSRRLCSKQRERSQDGQPVRLPQGSFRLDRRAAYVVSRPHGRDTTRETQGVGPVYWKMYRPKSRSEASTNFSPFSSCQISTPQKLLPPWSINAPTSSRRSWL